MKPHPSSAQALPTPQDCPTSCEVWGQPRHTTPALPSPQDYLTSREVRDQYRLSIPFLSQMRCRGEGPRFTRLGIRKVLYLRADVQTWLEAHAIKTKSAI